MRDTKKLFEATKANISRNRWLSFATILVISIIFTISSFFIGSATIARKAVSYYETKAQVIVFFKKETPELEIFKFRDDIYDKTLVENVEYISQEDALEIYKEDFKDNPDLIETVTADALPPSIGIRANSIESLQLVIENINTEKERNAYIEDVFYFKDVVDNMKTISKVINMGTIVMIIALSAITLTMINITIGLNILAHKEEIEIMHLVGGTDKYINTPFILEGAVYGATGAFIASLIVLTPIFIAVQYTKDTDFFFWISQLFNDLSLGFITDFTFPFVILFILSLMLIGSLFGSLSSYGAVLKYLKRNDR